MKGFGTLVLGASFLLGLFVTVASRADACVFLG